MRALTIKITADERIDTTVMFEPSGMTYELKGSGFMYADVPKPDRDEIEVVVWPGGISIWTPGSVVTRDSTGHELHRLN
jgi:hypothetical protein